MEHKIKHDVCYDSDGSLRLAKLTGPIGSDSLFCQCRADKNVTENQNKRGNGTCNKFGANMTTFVPNIYI